MDLEPWVNIIVLGLLTGGLYALASIGLTLIWGVMNFINFSSGQLIMLGMFISLAVVTAIGLDPLIGVVVATFVLFAIGLALEKVVIRPIMKSPRFLQVVVTLAIGIVIENAVQAVFGPEMLSMPRNVGSMNFLTQILVVGPVRTTYAKFLPLPVAAFLTIMLHLFLTRTRVGLGIRAISQSSYGAMLVGVNIKRAYSLTWGLGVSFFGLAGALMVLFRPAYPSVGWEFILIVFLAVTLGGAGSYLGSFVSAMAIGLIESISSFVFIPAIKQVIYLIIFIVVLIAFPRGLFPTREVG